MAAVNEITKREYWARGFFLNRMAGRREGEGKEESLFNSSLVVFLFLLLFEFVYCSKEGKGGLFIPCWSGPFACFYII